MPPHSETKQQPVCVLTRPLGQNAALAQSLQARWPGLAVIEHPLLDFVASADAGAAQAQLAECQAGDWLIFVSPRAVQFTAALLPLTQLPAVRFACIGSATANALQALRPDATPVVPATTADSEGLLAALHPSEFNATRVWLLRGQDGRDLLRERLRDWGATVTPVPVYQRRCAPPIEHWPFDAIWVITAPAALQCLHTAIMQCAESERARLLHCDLVLINSRSAELARRLSFTGTITLSHAPDDAALATACAQAVQRFMTQQELAS